MSDICIDDKWEEKYLDLDRKTGSSRALSSISKLVQLSVDVTTGTYQYCDVTVTGLISDHLTSTRNMSARILGKFQAFHI